MNSTYCLQNILNLARLYTGCMVRKFYNFHLSERKWISLLLLFSFAGSGTGVLIVRHLNDFIKCMHLWKFVKISSNSELKLEFRSNCFHIGYSTLHIDYFQQFGMLFYSNKTAFVIMICVDFPNNTVRLKWWDVNQISEFRRNLVSIEPNAYK